MSGPCQPNAGSTVDHIKGGKGAGGVDLERGRSLGQLLLLGQPPGHCCAGKGEVLGTDREVFLQQGLLAAVREGKGVGCQQQLREALREVPAGNPGWVVACWEK